jgi:hypothetical protein
MRLQVKAEDAEAATALLEQSALDESDAGA